MRALLVRIADADWLRALRTRSAGALGLLAPALGVLAVYCPPALLSRDKTLVGIDYFALHMRRLRFAQDALFGPHPYLPAWYPRELFGTPFWSNIQNFPFIPTRWPLLLVDPFVAYALAVNLAALLATLFTYLYCRRVGLGRPGAAAAGWTFACAGFFASRVMAGHLTLLEAYPALPLLLWLAEVSLQSPGDGWRFRLTLLAMGLGSACVILAGHPQLPIYALITAAAYILYRARSRRALETMGAMIVGVGIAGFSLWPMWKLILRSTRLVALGPARNDVPFPYYRLGAFLDPWKDGWALPVLRFPMRMFKGDRLAYFWDTVCYLGWIPLLAGLVLLIVLTRERRRPAPPWPFWVAVGLLALLLALPALHGLGLHLPALRSPARQLYLTTFALALALGVAVERVLSSRALNRRWAWGLVAVALAVHGVDLGVHDRYFIFVVPRSLRLLDIPIGDDVKQAVGDARVAIDHELLTALTWTNDDVGFFDSIALARPYRALMEISGASLRSNAEIADGGEFEARALAYGGAALVVTRLRRADLPVHRSPTPGVYTYTVPNPAPRAEFLPAAAALFLDQGEIHRRLRRQDVDLRATVMLPPGEYDLGSRERAPMSRPATTAYRRVSSDEIVVTVSTQEAGFLLLRESFDPAWRATVDGAPIGILPADDFLMAVPIRPGAHEVRFTFSTPGVKTGIAVSIASLVLLGVLALSGRSSPAPLLVTPPEKPAPRPAAILPRLRRRKRRKR